MVEDNSHAGQGAVALNIGGDVGALIVVTSEAMEGAEVEIRRQGVTSEPHVHYPHVAVVGRPVGARIVYCLVYAELVEGCYDLHVMPDGPVRMSATVVGGEVAEAVWPS